MLLFLNKKHELMINFEFHIRLDEQLLIETDYSVIILK